MKFQSTFKEFQSRKCISKCRLPNVGRFIHNVLNHGSCQWSMDGRYSWYSILVLRTANVRRRLSLAGLKPGISREEEILTSFVEESLIGTDKHDQISSRRRESHERQQRQG